MRTAAGLVRRLPPCISGRLGKRLYPWTLARRENAPFSVRSTLADVEFSYPEAEYHAVGFALRGFSEWQLVVIVNSVCRPGDVLFDIGSNVGTETLLFARRVGDGGKVHAFEPLPANVRALRDNVARNGLGQITVHAEAVGDMAGTCRFALPTAPQNSGNGRLLAEGEAVADSFEVDVVVIDEQVAAGRLPARPRMIVMDCEGAEPMVLRGAEALIREARPYLVLEVVPVFLKKHGFTSGDVHDWCVRRGYGVWEISGWGLKRLIRPDTRSHNWFCIPDEAEPSPRVLAAAIARRIRRAAFTPVWRGVNPAVVP
ncbi:MAG: FkbM family methyltransferase [Candidatus Krumholzibacteriota bacterium]|nr:FkbM family methyltransferase [Candidatus Krumholzibacteriota bacterium]